ncbi:MFS transporter [Ammoniphilus sp. CFH 90114]|uniref:MDR family MFS transporter n=1 Tax=Ammoniphilus sp. CFH 90114 TaxID=2493665 RepID=UPI00100EBD8C|nr:MFS transporter [Ammoniphilus sp. CFH 90114]RXT04885.1 MFS transporter [Ammoniphilus sp. CFH 90114]
MSWMRYPRELWILAIGMVINVTGMSFLWPLNTIYISQELGRSVSQAGFILMLHAGAGIFGSLLGGYLHDRIGGKKTILISVLASACLVFSLAYNQGWMAYITLMILLGFSIGMIFPVMYALAGGIWPEGGRKSFNLMYITQNLGVAIGSSLGGLVAQYSFQYVFLVNGLTYLLFLLIIWFGLRDQQVKQEKQPEQGKSEGQSYRGSGVISLVVLCFGFMVCWISYVQWQTSISSYMNELGFSLSFYSFLWAVNGLLIILLQPVSGYVTIYVLPSYRKQLLVGIMFFVASLVVLSQSQVYMGFVIGMAIMTLGEILIWPAVPSIAAELAPVGKSGFYQGIVNGSATGGRMMGPLIGGLLYDLYSPQILFYCMMSFCVIAYLCFTYYDRLLKTVGVKKEEPVYNTKG